MTLVSRRKTVAWTLFSAVAFGAVTWLAHEPPGPVFDLPVAVTVRSAPFFRDSRFSSLPAREPIGKQRGSLFETQAYEAPRAAAPRVVPQQAAPAPQPSSAPPMPYRVAGKVVRDGVVQVLLASGDELFRVREGETVEHRYRVESIGHEKVTLTYLPLELKQELPVVSALAAPGRPAAQVQVAPVAQVEAPVPSQGATVSGERAQLRWQGPERVRAGDRFEVTLKVTSGEALRAAPMQIAFDASVLEAVEVRPGRFFDGGTFTYRINPGGSIFVGAAGKGAPAADAEVFVASFKPIRPAVGAELRVSALMLQGTSGQAIGHERPAAFRTTIVAR